MVTLYFRLPFLGPAKHSHTFPIFRWIGRLASCDSAPLSYGTAKADIDPIDAKEWDRWNF